MGAGIFLSYIVLWILALTMALVLLLVVRQVGLIQRRLLPAGARTEAIGPVLEAAIPDFELVDVAGETATLGSRRGMYTLLVVVSKQCPVCAELLPAIRAVARAERDRLEIILLAADADVEAASTYFRTRVPTGVRCIVARSVAQQLGISAYPYGLVVGHRNQVLAKGVANHLEHLESLVAVLDPASGRMTAVGSGAVTAAGIGTQGSAAVGVIAADALE